MMSIELRALSALFAGAIAIGAAPIFVRLSDLGPEAVAFWRLAIGSLILLPTIPERHPQGLI